MRARAQRLAHIAANIVEPILDHLLLVELIEEMGAALQVEAEIDLLVRQPAGHARHGRGGKQVGKREQESGDDDAERPGSASIFGNAALPLSKLRIDLAVETV